MECTDIDECLIGTYNCPTNNDCLNTDGSYYCTCTSGYTNGSASALSIFIVEKLRLFMFADSFIKLQQWCL